MRAQFFILWGLLNLLVLPGAGQTLFNAHGEQFWIGSEAVVTVNGNLLNQGILSNNGSIAVSGDWLNEGIYNPGAGEIVLTGEQQQEITHAGQDIVVLRLEGAGEKVLNSELTVLERFICNEGIITTTAALPLILEAEAEAEGGNEASFVNGPMVYKGIGYRFFPVGKNGYFRPLELLDVQGVDPVLQVEVQGPKPAAKAGNRLEDVSRVRFWEVNVLEGLYSGSLVTLAVGSDEGFSDLSGVVVSGADQQEGVYENLGQSDFSGSADAGKVTSAVISDKPYLALGVTTEFSARDKVLVPSAFAPDAPDPQNRTLKVYAINVMPDAFVFKVFNRWGILVYETTSLDEALNTGWNGMNSNTNQPAGHGVYTYYLNAHFDNHQPIEQTGTITLFR